jgi:hypothetical protein
MGFDAHDLKVAFDDGVKAEQERLAAMLRKLIDTGSDESLANVLDGYLDIGEI